MTTYTLTTALRLALQAYLQTQCGLRCNAEYNPCEASELDQVLQNLTPNSGEAVAYITETTQGPMVWTPEMYGEACTYCDDDESPVPLYTEPSTKPAESYPAISLTRVGIDCVVAIEIGKEWVPVIEDNGDTISHIVESLGISRAVSNPKRGRQPTHNKEKPNDNDY